MMILIFNNWRKILLLAESVSPKFICWKLNAEVDGIRKWGLSEVIKSWMGFIP